MFRPILVIVAALVFAGFSTAQNRKYPEFWLGTKIDGNFYRTIDAPPFKIPPGMESELTEKVFQEQPDGSYKQIWPIEAPVPKKGAAVLLPLPRAPRVVEDRPAPEAVVPATPKTAVLDYVHVLDGEDKPEAFGRLADKLIRENARRAGIALDTSWERKVYLSWLSADEFAKQTKSRSKKTPGLAEFTFAPGGLGVEKAHVFLNSGGDADPTSVLRHELMHVVLARHFERQLPRWLDEGIACYVESEDETRRTESAFLESKKDLTLKQLIAQGLKYPEQDLGVFYGTSTAAVRALVDKYTLPKVIEFTSEGLRSADWDKASQAAFKVSLDDLDKEVNTKLSERKKAGK